MGNRCSLILAALLISGCANTSGSAGPANSSAPKEEQAGAPAKHIEAGVDLTFTCLDTFNETSVTLAAAWNAATLKWDVSIQEYDRRGQKISEVLNLVGALDDPQAWQMIVSDAAGLYAKLNQDGSDQATFNGRGRTMRCTFK